MSIPPPKASVRVFAVEAATFLRLVMMVVLGTVLIVLL
jgi:hypothetical protein